MAAMTSLGFTIWAKNTSGPAFRAVRRDINHTQRSFGTFNRGLGDWAKSIEDRLFSARTVIKLFAGSVVASLASGAAGFVAIGAAAAAAAAAAVGAAALFVAAWNTVNKDAFVDKFYEIKETLMRSMASAIDPWMDSIFAGMDRLSVRLRQSIERIGPQLGPVVKNTIGLVERLTDATLGGIEKMMPQADEFLKTLGRTATIIRHLFNVTNELAPSVNPIIGSVLKMVDGFIVHFIGNLGPVMGGFGGFLEKLLPGLNRFWQAFAGAMNELAPILPMLGSFLSNLLDNLGPALQSLMEALAKHMPSMLNVLTEFIDWAGAILKNKKVADVLVKVGIALLGIHTALKLIKKSAGVLELLRLVGLGKGSTSTLQVLTGGPGGVGGKGGGIPAEAGSIPAWLGLGGGKGKGKLASAGRLVKGVGLLAGLLGGIVLAADALQKSKTGRDFGQNFADTRSRWNENYDQGGFWGALRGHFNPGGKKANERVGKKGQSVLGMGLENIGVTENIRKAWNNLGTWLKNLWKNLGGAWQNTGTFIANVDKNVTNGVRNAWNATGMAIRVSWQNVRLFFANVFTFIGNIGRNTGNGIRNAWNAVGMFLRSVGNGIRIAWNAAGNGIRAVWTAAGNGIRMAWSGVGTFLRAIGSGIRTAWVAAGNGIRAAWNGIGTFFRATFNVIGVVGRAVGSSIRTAWTATGRVVKTAFNGAGAIASKAFAAIRTAALVVGRGIRAAWSATASFVRNAFRSAPVIIGNAFRAIGRVVSVVGKGIRTAWNGVRTAVVNASRAMGKGVVAAWNNMRSGLASVRARIWTSVIKPLGGFFATSLPRAAGTLRRRVVDIWTSMKNLLMGLRQKIWTGVIKPIGGFFATSLPRAANTLRTKVIGIWVGMGRRLNSIRGGIYNNVVKPLVYFFRRTIPNAANVLARNVANAFRNAKNWVGEMWEGVRVKVRAPVKWIVDRVYNRGIVALWNKVAGVVGGRKLGFMRFAKGGKVAGPGNGTSDSIPAVLSHGEHVWTAEEVRKAGGHNAVAKMRSSALGGRKVRATVDGQQEQAFALGGGVLGAIAKPFRKVKDLVRGAIAPVVQPVANALKGVIKRGLPGRTDWMAKSRSIATRPIDAIMDWIDKDDAANSAMGMGYKEMFKWIKARVPGTRLASGLRKGDPGYHGKGQAVDLTFSDGSERRGGPGKGKAGRAFNIIKKTFKKDIAELIWDFAKGQAVWNGKNHFFTGGSAGPGTHNDHIHWASATASGGKGSVKRWGGLVASVLRELKMYSSSNFRHVMNAIKTESGGNPRAVNNWDSNAARGTPSKGLIQTIKPTFDAYAGKYRKRGQLDPRASLYAGIRYARARYGKNWAARMDAPPGVGYETGTGGARQGWHKVGEAGPEWIKFRGGEEVLNNTETKRISNSPGGSLSVSICFEGDVYAKSSKDFENMITEAIHNLERKKRFRR